MNNLERFLTGQNAQVSIWWFLVNLLLAAALGYVLGRMYVRYGNALSNRQMFARNFVLITVTTCLIITVVKSSLALSLGLVGALSIVRFRAAIKEPEELAYLFLAISIGLGFGADQRLITITAFAVIVAVIWLKNLSYRREKNQNLYLTVSSHNPRKLELREIVETLEKHCSRVTLKRFDETKEELEAAFLVEYAGFSELEESRLQLKAAGESVRVTFLDNQGIGI